MTVTTIIEGVFSKLVLSRDSRSVSLLEGAGLVKQNRGTIENLDLNQREGEVEGSDEQIVRQYLVERTQEGGLKSMFQSTRLRFDKLALGAELLGMLRSGEAALDEEKVKKFYDKALDLQSFNGYPAGELGAIILKLRCRVDDSFRQEYEAVPNQIIVLI